jgi:hypothetical protein
MARQTVRQVLRLAASLAVGLGLEIATFREESGESMYLRDTDSVR